MLKFKLGSPPDDDIVRHDARWKAVAGYDATPSGALRMLMVGFTCILVLFGLWRMLVRERCR